MTMLEATLNTPLVFAISGPAGVSASDFAIYINGVLAIPSQATITQLGVSSVWSVALTPLTTGVYSIYCFGSVKEQVTCVAKSVQSFLANIEDEALGSWAWNKQTGVLTLLRQNGTTLSTYSVVDTSGTASRERTS
jgi:hypothetical protein